jgi:glycerol-3-phosphate acyltransferase PlsY
MTLLLLGIVVLAAYFMGALPAGYLWVRLLTGQDVRQLGSGRTGGTNALRVGGRIAGMLTGITDFAKGLAGVGLARLLLPPEQHPLLGPWAAALAGAAAVAGHIWSIYIGFRGGAGTGPNIGASTALFWPSGLLLIPLVPLLLLATGYASVTSLVIAALIPVIYLALALAAGWPWAYVVYGAATLVLIVLALRPNIRRLQAGTERMVGPRARRRAARDGSSS